MKSKILFVFIFLFFIPMLPAAEAGRVPLGQALPLWSILPFAGILLSIALFPLLASKFWSGHFGKVSLFWSLVFFIPFLFWRPGEAISEMLHTAIIDYIPFIILLWALFTISGGILIRGTLKGTPGVNLLILLCGTCLSSWIGTTGSAMLLIRPLIRANKQRHHQVHTIVFFIFLVANISGALTPLGDPPLFLGFLHSVPFFWTFHVFPHMALAAVILLLIFFLFDTYYYRKEQACAPAAVEKGNGSRCGWSDWSISSSCWG